MIRIGTPVVDSRRPTEVGVLCTVFSQFGARCCKVRFGDRLRNVPEAYLVRASLAYRRKRDLELEALKDVVAGLASARPAERPRRNGSEADLTGEVAAALGVGREEAVRRAAAVGLTMREVLEAVK